MFRKSLIRKNFTIFTGKQLYEKETPTQAFSNEYCELLKNRFF